VTQLEALALSLLIEVPVALALGMQLQPGVARDRLALVALCATLLTHPFAVAAFRQLDAVPYAARAVAIETAVALVEAALYVRLADLSRRNGLAVGFVANAASFLTGLAIRLGT
jgi:hypothetical protein